MNAIAATGISSDGVKAEFEQHAKEEQGHMRQVADRINQLGGTPNFNPEGLASRSASQYVEGANLVEMIKENLVAERIACEHYRELIRYFADKDPTTRVMMEAHSHQRRRARQRHARSARRARRQTYAEEPRVSARALASSGSASCFRSSASRNSFRGRPPP